MHDRPQDAIRSPGLQAHGSFGELLVDVGTEGWRRGDLRHCARHLPHGGVELHPRQVAGVLAELGRPGATDRRFGNRGDQTIFTLGTSIAAVAEAAVGRTGSTQLGQYTSDLARVQLNPAVWEVPGAMPEISPSPAFGANIDKKFTERSMGLQAWGTYGVLWPVVHFELGVSPDLGRNAVAVIPQIPVGQSAVSGSDIKLGQGSIDVDAVRSASMLTTTVASHDLSAAEAVGAMLPTGTQAATVRLNGVDASHHTVATVRGTEIVVDVPSGIQTAKLQVSF